MKPALHLSIPKPCSEKWKDFTATPNGGFCTSCCKTVIDFTAMNDDQIFEFLRNKPDHACGRFRPHQLKVYSHPAALKINPGFTLLKAGFLSLLFVLLNKQTSAKSTDPKTRTEVVWHVNVPTEERYSKDPDHIVKGIVKDESGDLLPGINIVLKGTETGTMTDVDGRFEFPRKLNEGDILIFSFIGFKTKEYKIPDKIEEGIDIVMELEMDFEIMGELAVNGHYKPHKTGLRGMWSKVKALF